MDRMDVEEDREGAAAASLLREFRHRREELLLAFQEDKRRKICEEINNQYSRAVKIEEMDSTPGLENDLINCNQRIARNKRCMLAYLRARLDLIEKIRWDVGMLPAELSDKMNPGEQKYYDDYNSVLASYMGDIGLDLTSNIANPPSHLLIQVQVLETKGEVSLADGTTISLKADRRLFMNRVDAEPFIRQGVLEHVL